MITLFSITLPCGYSSGKNDNFPDFYRFLPIFRTFLGDFTTYVLHLKVQTDVTAASCGSTQLCHLESTTEGLLVSRKAMLLSLRPSRDYWIANVTRKAASFLCVVGRAPHATAAELPDVWWTSFRAHVQPFCGSRQSNHAFLWMQTFNCATICMMW